MPSSCHSYPAVFVADENIALMRSSLLHWFDLNGRHWIPWKLTVNGTPAKDSEVLDVYRIWVAEIMLQQTQLNVVIPYWDRWMKAFPSVDVLACSKEDDVLLLWQGLGYYSRARRIHSSSKLLSNNFSSRDLKSQLSWPRDISFWLSLPGIGRTTAASILSSAFNIPEPLLDGNVKRVLSRLIALSGPVKSSIPKLWIFSEKLLDKDHPRRFNQAMMDLGAIICTPKNPNCLKCPLNHLCIAYALGQSSQFPVKTAKKKSDYQVIGIGIVFNSSGEVLIDKRLEEGVLGGMWEFPGGKQEDGETIEETIARELEEELAIKVKVGQLLISLKHSYSHKDLHFIVHLCSLVEGEPIPLASQKVVWTLPKELSQFPFPSANKKIIAALTNHLKKNKSMEMS